MERLVKPARMLVRIAAILMIAMGIALWTGNADSLKGLHLLIGLALVLALWTLAAAAFRAGAPLGLVAFTIAWSIFMPLFGLSQERIAPGSGHWTVQVAHLLVGLLAIALGERLAMKSASRAPSMGALA